MPFVAEQPLPAFAVQETQKFLRDLDDIHLVAIEQDGPASGRHFAEDSRAATPWALEYNQGGANVYWTVNPVRAGLHKKPRKNDIVAARFAHVDIDPPKDGSLWSKKAALDTLQGHHHAPSFIIDSGNGLQAFWRLAERVEHWQTVEDLNDLLRRHFNADACHNIDRLMRLPGLRNYPNAKKRAAGRRVVRAEIAVADSGAFYEVDQLRAVLCPPPGKPWDSRNLRQSAEGPTDGELLTSDDLKLDAYDPIRSAIDNPPGLDRSRDVLAATRLMANAGFSNRQILGILVNPSNAVSAHIHAQSSPQRAVSRALAKVRSIAHPPDAMPSGRAQIKVLSGQLHEMATQGEQALIEERAPFYSRSESIVRPVVDEMPAAHGVMTRVPRLRRVDRDMMLDHLSRCATWMKYNERKKRWLRCNPPLSVAATILSRDGEWLFSQLAGVITTPTLRRDGTILSEPGYDPATRLLLLDPPLMPEISENPSRDEALDALHVLDGLLDQFPFKDDASRSVALSGLITPVVRGAMAVAPLHATTAPVAGSGKSYLVDIASAISVGQRAPVIAIGRTEEETEKRLVAALLGGQPIVAIDNVNGQLGGDFLCQMIERPVVSPRVLGLSKNETIESRATCFATGNNIQLVGDMTRRVLLCSLDPNMERPELRTFNSSPYDDVIANRGKFIAAALTVVRAYIVAGCPDELPSLASFEQWSRLVRSALVWLDRVDPVTSMDAVRRDDPITTSLRSLYRAWYDSVGDSLWTTGALKGLAEEPDQLGNPSRRELLHALEEVAERRGGGIDTKRLGRFLGRHSGRIFDGLKLEDEYDTHTKQKKWRIVRV